MRVKHALRVSKVYNPLPLGGVLVGPDSYVLWRHLSTCQIDLCISSEVTDSSFWRNCCSFRHDTGYTAHCKLAVVH